MPPVSMLRTIEVSGQWTRYKSDTPIPPGQYYLFHGRPDSTTKAALDLIAATAPDTGRFCWLAPCETWVKRIIDGKLDAPVLPYSEAAVEWPIEPSALRSWQRRFLALAYGSLVRKGRFRRGVVASLGGGKTLTGLVMSTWGDVTVVLAPRYLHSTWQEEAIKWGVPVPHVTTYESAHKAPKPDVLIIDEALALKNPLSQRHQKAVTLASGVPVVVGLTATPIGGKGPMDWRWMRVVEPGCVPQAERSWRHLWGLDTHLAEVAPGRNAYVTTQWDADRIAQFVNPYVTTVDTSDLIADLPEISYRRVYLPQPKDYPFIRAGAASSVSKSKVIAQCRQCSDGHITQDDGTAVPLSQEKLSAIREFIETLGEPVVVYASWDHTITRLAETLSDLQPAVIRGSTTNPGWEIKRFTSGLARVLIANSRFSQGMNLQERCRVICFLSWSLNPTDRTQAIGRVYRPGQTRGCIVVDFLCRDTMDERTLELITKHQNMTETQIEKLLEGEL